MLEVKYMPNIRSAKKRVLVTKVKTLQNTMIKSALRTAIKKFNIAVENKDANVQEAYALAVKKLDQACAKGIMHKNTASRQKSQLAKKLNSVNA